MLCETESLKEIIIPDSVTSIGIGAFTGGGANAASGITSIDIPDSVKTIGDYAFTGCDKLIKLNLGNGVTTIGNYAFDDCGLVVIDVPDSVTSIGKRAFGDSRITCSSGSYAEQYANDNGVEIVVTAGFLNNNVAWQLNTNGELIISGTGSMPDFSMLSLFTASTSASWKDSKIFSLPNFKDTSSVISTLDCLV